MDRIMEILEELRPEFDYKTSTDFIEDGLLDSFDMVSLVTELENEYDILIDALDIVPENFANVQAIAEVVTRNGGEL